ncbi:uncharacterized protein LOC127396177 [Apus apus]|uniref:uncharacterized protein LOC127396177 n=1 Tax=Apus apus TaxID=8895 RepID=UPI0021F8F93B|nr:uncharacterized protein LOC127396177 [Apus apus]
MGRHALGNKESPPMVHLLMLDLQKTWFKNQIQNGCAGVTTQDICSSPGDGHLPAPELSLSSSKPEEGGSVVLHCLIVGQFPATRVVLCKDEVEQQSLKATKGQQNLFVLQNVTVGSTGLYRCGYQHKDDRNWAEVPAPRQGHQPQLLLPNPSPEASCWEWWSPPCSSWLQAAPAPSGKDSVETDARGSTRFPVKRHKRRNPMSSSTPPSGMLDGPGMTFLQQEDGFFTPKTCYFLSILCQNPGVPEVTPSATYATISPRGSSRPRGQSPPLAPAPSGDVHGSTQSNHISIPGWKV